MDQDKITNLQTSYDHIAEKYVQRIYDELKDKPLDRQLLDRFASSVQGLEPVCDMGCGPGHVGRYLHEQGVAQVIGVDLSPSMLEQARRLNPGIEFIQGNMLALDTENDAWGGIAAFYSIIHIPREEVVTALCEAARSHQSIFYNLLFRASADTTQRLAQDPHFVGGQLGLVGILHTWGRNLSYHPHIHYLVPAGGLAADGHTLRCSGQAWHPARRDFLLPVKALSKIFRGKFRQALQKTALCTHIPAKVRQQDWVVHCKPVGDGRTALKYLAPYIFRVAISNRRLVKLEHDQVTFRYRTSDTGRLRLCTLSAEEFIHRFLQHVLPKGFVKVRYFGFFAPGCRKHLVTLRHWLVNTYPDRDELDEPGESKEPAISAPTSVVRCPNCGQAMHLERTIQPTVRCPP